MIEQIGDPVEERGEPEPEITPEMVEAAIERIRSEQSLAGGIIAGLIAALAGAGVWAAVTAATEYQIGWMAVGVGFLVGFAVRVGGKGVDKPFGIAGAALALLGCLLGNLITVCWIVGVEEGMSVIEVLLMLDLCIEILWATFSPMDLLFYGIAVYEGYRFAFRALTQEMLLAEIRDR